MEETLFHDHPIRLWLIKQIYVSNWIYIDGWSLVHFASGLLVGLILSKRFSGATFYSLTFTLLFVWEIWENLSGQRIFGTEPFIDIFWDMIIGMLGAILVYQYKRFSIK